MERSRFIWSKVAVGIKNFYRHILSAALIGLLVMIVYGQDLEILANEALQNEALNHVILIPFLAGFLFYLKKDLVKASLALGKRQKQAKVRYVDELVGVILCLVAFLVYWYGSFTFYPLEYHLLSLPIFIMGIALILLNFEALVMLIFPILFLLFLVPIPTEFTYTLGGAMANFNTQISYSLMEVFGLPVTLSSEYGPPTILLMTSTGKPLSFAVDLPCSGIYSMIAFAMFAAFLAFVVSASTLKKLLIFAFGFLIFEILNVIRIVSIVSVGYWFGEEIAMVLFHTVAGLLLIFIGMLFVLVFADKILKVQILTTPQEQQSCPKCKISLKNLENFCQNCGKFLDQANLRISKASFVKLLLLLLCCSAVVLSIHAPTFAVAQGPIELTSNVGWQNATNVFPEIPGYKLSFLYRDTDFEKVARQDASLVYGYFPLNESRSLVYVNVGVASSISNLHSWEVCLITWQTSQGRYPVVNVLDSRDIQLLQDVPIVARYLVFESPANYTQVTLYWYEKATFSTGITVEQKYVRISLIILTRNSADYPQLEEELLTVGQIVASKWEPLKTQSLISLGVPAQQLLLIISVAFLFTTKTAQYFAEQRRKINNLKLFNNFASKQEKLVLQTILDLAKDKKSMGTRDIVENVKSKRGKSMRSKKLLNILTSLEKYGFVKRSLISVKNKAQLVWTT